jgi:hypothetical protein
VPLDQDVNEAISRLHFGATLPFWDAAVVSKRGDWHRLKNGQPVALLLRLDEAEPCQLPS